MRYTRKLLISICEQAFVPIEKWAHTDSYDVQGKTGRCLVLLKAGCDFRVLTIKNNPPKKKPRSLCNRLNLAPIATNDHTIWLEIRHKRRKYSFCKDLELFKEIFYLPTFKRLEKAAGNDWYPNEKTA